MSALVSTPEQFVPLDLDRHADGATVKAKSKAKETADGEKDTYWQMGLLPMDSFADIPVPESDFEEQQLQ